MDEELLLIKFPDNNTYVELIVSLLSFHLNAYPFFVVLDVVIKHIQDPMPWYMLFVRSLFGEWKRLKWEVVETCFCST